MNYDQFFMDDQFVNLKLAEEIGKLTMSRLLQSSDPNHSTIPTDIESYGDFLRGRSLSHEGKRWEDVIEEFTHMFGNMVQWHAPSTMVNITPPVFIPGLVAAFFSLLYNANFATDESTGFLSSTELIAIRYFSQLANWDAQAGGVFTFGGKGTNMYALRCSLDKAMPESRNTGVHAGAAVVLVSEKCHPCQKEIVEWLGIGRDNVITLKTDLNGQVSPKDVEHEIRSAIASGKKIAGIFLSGGTTNEGFIDPIKKIVDVRDRCVEEYSLSYSPHIHVDAVIGWVWLFFQNYDFHKNPLGFSPATLKKIHSATDKISELCYADSFGADMHKLGFCPYSSSIFMVKNSSDLGKRARSIKAAETMKHGEYAPFEYTLELSRSPLGPVSTYVTFEMLGINGFQRLIGHLFSLGEQLREDINAFNDFETINMQTEGFATLFIAKPPCWKHLNFNQIISDYSRIDTLREYNLQLYLHAQKAYQENRIGVHITFSKSYKPYGAPKTTGALKAYPTSPVTLFEQSNTCIHEFLCLKEEFDQQKLNYVDNLDRPEDLVWRN